MDYPLPHATQDWLKSFSKRLPSLVAPGHQPHVDPQIQADDRRYNLVRTLAHLISELSLPDHGMAAFEKALEAFNTSQTTALRFEELAVAGWVRLINDELRIPETGAHFLGQVERAAELGKPLEVPAHQARQFEFISTFYQQYDSEEQPTISPAVLGRVLAAHADVSIDTSFLVAQKILREEAGQYSWLGGYYVRQLHDEIAALLWQLTGGGEPTEKQLRHYLRQLHHAGVWPRDWAQYLTPREAARLSALAVNVLLSETDLLDTGQEFTKIWFDSPRYADRNLFEKAPWVSFKRESSWALLQSVEAHQARFGEALDHQPIRQPYSLLLRLTTAPDPAHPVPFHQTLRLLRAADRPFVVQGVFQQLRTTNTAAIPYLLADPQLLPLAFKALAEIALADFLVPEQANRDEQHRQLREVRNRLWLELFAGALDIVTVDDEALPAFGEALGHTLYGLAEEAFISQGNGPQATYAHTASLDLYMKALSMLAAKRIAPAHRSYSYPDVPPLLIEECFAAIARPLIAQKKAVTHYEQLSLDLAALDLGAELLKISHALARPNELQTDAPDTVSATALEAARQELLNHLRDLLRIYLTTNKVLVETYTPGGPEARIARWNSDYYGTERVNWGYLCAQLYKAGLLQELTSGFLNAVPLDRLSSKGKYEHTNQLATGKLRLLLKVLLLAYLNVRAEAINYEAEDLPATSLLHWLEDTIERVATRYAHDDLPRGQLDIFDERIVVMHHPAHWVSLITLLYKAVNEFEGKSRVRFIKDFFAQSVDIGRMLTALNLLESPELQQGITQRLEQVDVTEFLSSRHTVTDLETALVEAINSRSHWQQFAQPLLLRVQQHFQERDYHPDHGQMLFEIELLLAFKRKDSVHLAQVAEPDTSQYAYDERAALDELKTFYIALDQLYNQRAYPGAIRLLESLLAADARNVRYAFHLYRARTLLATLLAMDVQLLVTAHRQWEAFLGQLSEDDKRDHAGLLTAVDSTSLAYLSHVRDDGRFDHIVQRLADSHLFDEDLMAVIHENYRSRALHERAFHYLTDAERYYAGHDLPPPAVLHRLLQRQPDAVTIDRLRATLGRLASQRAETIPRILPAKLNGHSDLGEFILHEFVQAAKILAEKIEGIRQITQENRFNDLLTAVLSLRLAVWDWAIQDQPRVGQSETGKDAGEADILIKAAGTTLALLEALILRDEPSTIRHILKCQQYVANVSRFYVVSYHLKPRAELDDRWMAYKKTIQTIAYPPDFALHPPQQLKDLSDKLADAEYLRVARTKHGKNSVVMYHLMINLPTA